MHLPRNIMKPLNLTILIIHLKISLLIKLLDNILNRRKSIRRRKLVPLLRQYIAIDILIDRLTMQIGIADDIGAG